MPNRMLRDFTCSELIDKLSPEGEVFFIRLIMKADDYGAYHGNPKLLKSNLYPLKEITSKQVEGWIKELQGAGLIIHYEADGKKFLEIKEFNQRLRQKNRKFPPPPDDWEELPAHDRKPPLEEKRREEEEEEKKEDETSGVGLIIVKDEIILLCPFFYDKDFESLWKEWEGVRRRKKASTSKQAMKRAINKLMKLSNGNKEIASQIIAASCDGGWSDLYQLKTNNNNNGNRTQQNSSDSEERTKRLADELLGEINSTQEGGN